MKTQKNSSGPEEESSISLLQGTFDTQDYVVTDFGCQCLHVLLCPLIWTPLIPGVLGKKRLVLEKDEAVLMVDSCCYQVNTRMPYGELSSVEKGRYCCCTGFSSGLASLGGNQVPMCIGQYPFNG